MAKLTLTDIATFTPSAITAINNNNAAIEAAMEITLSRDGTTPNSMSADLDMNSNAILNMTELDMNSNKIVNMEDGTVSGDAVTFDQLNAVSTASGNMPIGGTAGQILIKQSSVTYDALWEDVSETGAVIGPASSTNNSLARFDGTTGKLLKDGAVIGTDVQAYDADLDAIAALSTSAAGRSTLTITDPNADRVLAWDDSAGTVSPIALANITTEASPATGDYALIYGAEGDLRKVDWSDLPSGGSGSGKISVTDHGAVGDGTTDDSSAIATALAAVISAGGGTLYFPKGTYRIDTGLSTITTDGVYFEFESGCTIDYRGLASAPLFEWEGVRGSDIDIVADVTAGDFDLELTSTTGLSVGDQVMVITTATADAQRIHTWIGKITAISSPTITLDVGAPLDFTVASQSRFAVNELTCVKNGGIIGNGLVIDAINSGAGGHALIHPTVVEDFDFNNFTVKNATTSHASYAGAFFAHIGNRCTFSKLRFYRSGSSSSPSSSDFFMLRQTNSNCFGIASEHGVGFGPHISSSSYCAISSWTSIFAAARGMKITACANCAVSNMVVASAGLNGFGVTNGTSRCSFTGVVVNGCYEGLPTSATGIWLTDQSNQDNVFVGCTSRNNLTYALNVGPTDTNNQFIGINATGTSNVDASSKSVILGAVGSSIRGLSLPGSTSGTVKLQANPSTTSYSFQFPNTAGTSGHVLQTDGTGVTSWVAGGGGGGTPGGADTQVQFNSAGSFGGSANLTWVSPKLTLGTAASTAGQLAFANATSGTITVQAVTGALGTVTLSLPAATDTLVGKATTDTFTNKTYDTAGTGNSFSINGLAATANTGTGAVVRATSPTLVTPALGTPSSGTLTNCTGLPISTGVSGLGTGVATALAVNVGSAGAFVTFNGALGTPSSGTLTNATGLPVSTGISGLGTGVATFLATPSSANLAAAVTNETGSGALVFATSPTLVTPALGTPSSGTLTNCTGLPISTGVSGLGTNVATALAVNVGTAGAFVVNGGALGTPSSGTLTNCTGLPSIVVANEATDTTCFLGFFTAASGELAPKTNAALAFDSSTGALGIGDSAPASRLVVSSNSASGVSPASNTLLHLVAPDTVSSVLTFDSYGAAGGIAIVGRSATGTAASQTATVSGNALLSFGGRGHDGTNFVTSNKALILFSASENWSGSAQGCHFEFYTTKATTTTRTAQVRIPDDGGIAVKDGITAPGATAGWAKIYVDTSDGDLKVIFGDGTVKTIITDT